MTSRVLILVAILTALVAPHAAATQHLVRPGDDWSRLSRVVREGDEIILMPGEHRPGTLDGIIGTKQRRIVIRGAMDDHSSVIVASRYGLVLLGAQHVVVKDLVIRDATIYGVHIRGPEGGESDSIQLRNVRVERTGPQGRRQGIRVERARNVSIIDSVVDGWGDSGLELVACRTVAVTNTVFQGRPGFSQISGIRVRAGTRNLQVIKCRFIDCGDQGICAGAKSDLDEFHPPLDPKAAAGSTYETSGISINNSIFRGGNCAIGIVSVKDILVGNCTIVAPKYAILSFRHETEDPRLAVLEEGTFRDNIVAWPEGGLTRLAHLVHADAEAMLLQENLWWTPNFAAHQDRLGPWPGTRLNDAEQSIADPLLDADHRPHAAIARSFGALDVVTESAGVGPGD